MDSLLFILCNKKARRVTEVAASETQRAKIFIAYYPSATRVSPSCHLQAARAAAKIILLT